MGERKVLNKYIPPDFDPSKVPKGKRPADGQIKVRMMLPMSICCQTCGNFISKGTKFNSRKEDAKGETYLGLRIFRFYFRCPRCSGEIAMKTDPENSDYIGKSERKREIEFVGEKGHFFVVVFASSSSRGTSREHPLVSVVPFSSRSFFLSLFVCRYTRALSLSAIRCASRYYSRQKRSPFNFTCASVSKTTNSRIRRVSKLRAVERRGNRERVERAGEERG